MPSSAPANSVRGSRGCTVRPKTRLSLHSPFMTRRQLSPPSPLNHSPLPIVPAQIVYFPDMAFPPRVFSSSYSSSFRGALAHRRCATQQAHACVRREGRRARNPYSRGRRSWIPDSLAVLGLRNDVRVVGAAVEEGDKEAVGAVHGGR